MAVELVYETHSISLDNERGIATGWLPGELSEEGRRLAGELGRRRREDGIACVFTSDLRRAVETAEIAFAGSGIEIRQDERLRECNYGELNGAPVERLDPRARFVDEPYPGGESYRDCVVKMRGFLEDVAAEFDGRRVLVIAHSAQRWALQHLIKAVPLERLVDAPFEWQEGWEYLVPVLSRPTKLMARLYRAASPLTLLGLIVGLFSGALGWRPGVFLALGAISLDFACHLALGITSYREVMSRPWPKVEPLPDDDD